MERPTNTYYTNCQSEAQGGVRVCTRTLPLSPRPPPETTPALNVPTFNLPTLLAAEAVPPSPQPMVLPVQNQPQPADLKHYPCICRALYTVLHGKDVKLAATTDDWRIPVQVTFLSGIFHYVWECLMGRF